MQSAGYQPQMLVLVTTQAEHADEAERAYIARLKRLGHQLTNGTSGGEGGSPTAETRQKLSNNMKKRIRDGTWFQPTRTPEQTAKISAMMSTLRKTVNPMKNQAIAAKCAASLRARSRARGYVPPIRLKRGSPEYTAMVTKRNQRTLARADVRSKLSKALKGRVISSAHSRAISSAFADKSGIFVNGVPASFLGAANYVKRDRKTIRQFAKRHRCSLQQALDRYAKLLPAQNSPHR